VDRSNFRLPVFVIYTSEVEVLRRPVESALAATITVMDQPSTLDRAALMDGLFEGIQDEPGMRGGADPSR
jgi:hypothetical protein